MNKFRAKWIKPVLPWLVLAILIMLVYMLLQSVGIIGEAIGGFWAVLRPIFFGFILAYLLDMPRSGLEKLFGKIKYKGNHVRFIDRRKRGISILITYLLFVFAFGGVLVLFVPYLGSTIAGFVSYVLSLLGNTEFIDSTINNINDFVANLGFFDDPENPLITQYLIDDFIDNVTLNMLSIENIFDGTRNVAAVAGGAAAGFAMTIFNWILTFVSSIFVMIEKDKIRSFVGRTLRALTSSAFFSTFTNYANRLNTNFKRYLVVQTIDGAILGTIVTLQLWLIIRTPYFLVLGIILALFNYIPYVGSIVATAIAVMVVMLTESVGLGMLTLGILFVTQQIDANIIQPKLMGSSFKISPLLIIISVLVGGHIAGIPGMLIAIPVLAILKDVIENLIAFYERKKGLAINITEEITASPPQSDNK